MLFSVIVPIYNIEKYLSRCIESVLAQTYSDYELGKTRIPLESIIKLAKYYDVSLDYICGVTDLKTSFPNK